MSSDQKRIMMCIHLFKKKKERREGREGGREKRKKEKRKEWRKYRKLVSKYGLMKVQRELGMELDHSKGAQLLSLWSFNISFFKKEAMKSHIWYVI